MSLRPPPSSRPRQNTDHTTTILGIMAGAVVYWSQAGFVFPTTRQEIASLCGGCLLAGLGYYTNKPSLSPPKERKR